MKNAFDSKTLIAVLVLVLPSMARVIIETYSPGANIERDSLELNVSANGSGILGTKVNPCSLTPLILERWNLQRIDLVYDR